MADTKNHNPDLKITYIRVAERHLLYAWIFAMSKHPVGSACLRMCEHL